MFLLFQPQVQQRLIWVAWTPWLCLPRRSFRWLIRLSKPFVRLWLGLQDPGWGWRCQLNSWRVPHTRHWLLLSPDLADLEDEAKAVHCTALVELFSLQPSSLPEPQLSLEPKTSPEPQISTVSGPAPVCQFLSLLQSLCHSHCFSLFLSLRCCLCQLPSLCRDQLPSLRLSLCQSLGLRLSLCQCVSASASDL